MPPFPPSVANDASNAAPSRSRSPLLFFLIVFALSLPFWMAGALTGIQLSPGLPVSSLMFICPATAALILVYRENKTVGVTELLKRSFDYKRIRARIWYVPLVFLKPVIMVLSYGLMLRMGVPLPAPQFTVLAALAMFLVFFITALGEELGWTGYVMEPMQDRWARSRPASSWGRQGRLAHRTAGAGRPIGSMDRLVVSLHGVNAGPESLALQQHGQERLRRNAVPRHVKRQLALVSDLRFILRSAYHWPDHRVRCDTRHSRMGATTVGSEQSRLTRSGNATATATAARSPT